MVYLEASLRVYEFVLVPKGSPLVGSFLLYWNWRAGKIPQGVVLGAAFCLSKENVFVCEKVRVFEFFS